VKIATWKVAATIAGKSVDGESVRARFFSGVLEKHRANPSGFKRLSREEISDRNLHQAILMT
jgi:hypothetical protein